MIVWPTWIEAFVDNKNFLNPLVYCTEGLSDSQRSSLSITLVAFNAEVLPLLRAEADLSRDPILPSKHKCLMKAQGLSAKTMVEMPYGLHARNDLLDPR